DVNNG
ncbi:hypothetical protein ECFRIK523_1807, partial [Escherichia coli FRIK523]